MIGVFTWWANTGYIPECLQARHFMPLGECLRSVKIQSDPRGTPDKLQKFRFHLHVIVECPLYNVLKVPKSPMMGYISFRRIVSTL